MLKAAPSGCQEIGGQMKIRIKKSICMFIVAALLAGVLPKAVSAVENGVTVSTSDEFMAALQQHKSPITVAGMITIGDGAEADGRMLPVEIPADTVIQGTEGSSLNSRSPIQLGGAACFQNIELTFNSTDSLGSVPHREIFLAGHSLTLDNVKTWLQGGGDSLGGFGGTEEELLPTVYAGGFTNTHVADNASLTVRNSNDKTMFQAIYMGHDTESDKKVPYQGTAVLNLDSKVTVRGRVDVSQNSQADINISGGENDSVRVKEYYGNEDSTLTLSKSSLSDAILEGVGNIILTDKACLSPKTSTFKNVTLQRGGCLDLNGVSDVSDVRISGNFTGVGDPAEEKGILVVNKQSSLTIGGMVTGTTRFQTDHRFFPGTFLLGWPYISADQGNASKSNFILSENSIENGYEIKYSGGNWSVGLAGQEEVKEIGSIEIVSAPSQVGLDSIAGKQDGTIPNENSYFEIIWRDMDGNAFSTEEVEELMLYEMDYIFVIRTEYWESDDPDIQAKTDWGNAISLMTSEEYPGRYFLQAADGALVGDYTFLFCSDYCTDQLETVQDVKDLRELVKVEKRVTFLDKEPEQKPEPTQMPTAEPTSAPESSPEPTQMPTAEPTSAPEPSPEPTPKPTSAPEQSPKPTPKPTSIPEPSPEATPTVKPEPAPEQSSKPIPTADPTPVPPQSAEPDKGLSGTEKVQKPKGTKILKLSAASRGFLVKWKKQRKQTTGYEIQYSTGRKFAKKTTKKVMIKSNKKVSHKISGIKPKKKYYVRIRTYRTTKINGRTAKVYSRWSGVRSVKTKRVAH